ncbi:MAG: hypothetical protein H6741_05645 [Alphaproteobacteria bacterium]|nr:hypothetical protein [Alphaproteobacteria bacterium]
MHARTKTMTSTLAALTLQLALSGAAYAQEGALYYDAQTSLDRANSDVSIEGMAWGYFHTGTLTEPLTISAAEPITIQLYDDDQSERYYRSADDELQLWMSDTNLTAQAGESVRFEFFSIVPTDMLDAANDSYEGELELRARVLDGPGSFASTFGGVSFSHSGQSFTGRANTFSGYPAADHVVTLYYVYTDDGFSGYTPRGDSVPSIVSSGNKEIWGRAGIPETMIDSGTNENIWDNGTTGRSMSGFIIVQNSSDREGLPVTLDFMRLMEDDSPNLAGNDDDLLGEATSTAPANFNLGPGGTLMWRVSVRPEYDAISDARDFANGDGDLEPYAVFSVNGDPDLPVDILPDAEADAYGEDLPDATFRFAAAEIPDPLPNPPIVAYAGDAGTYTVDEDVSITCTVTDGGGGVVFDTCSDVSGPAWSFEAGVNSYSASAWDVYGQEGSDTVSFTVEVTHDSLIAITERFVDHNGIENSLTQKISGAERANNDNAHDAKIQAYINELEAQSGNHVDSNDAEVLIYWAEVLMLQ